jgi:hypothetical protein
MRKVGVLGLSLMTSLVLESVEKFGATSQELSYQNNKKGSWKNDILIKMEPTRVKL